MGAPLYRGAPMKGCLYAGAHRYRGITVSGIFICIHIYIGVPLHTGSSI